MQTDYSRKQRPLYVGFGSLKGGVGKSSIAEVLASYLFYEQGIHLFVVDCDYSQYSFYKLRERDKERVQSGSPALQGRVKAMLDHLGKPFYRVLKSTSQNALREAEQFLQSRPHENFDMVIFDLPGRADDKHLVSLTVEMDYLLSPIEPDPQSLIASMSYALAVRDLGVSLTSCRLQQLFLFWNKVDRRVKGDLIDFYNARIEQEGLGRFRTQLPRSARFAKELSETSREVFRCTYLPPDKQLLLGSNIPAFADELLSFLSLTPKLTNTDANDTRTT